MKLAFASPTLLAVAIVALVIRGPADWSGGFAAFWYGVFAAACVCAILGVVWAVTSRRLTPAGRTWVVVLALPALVAIPLLVAVILALAAVAD